MKREKIVVIAGPTASGKTSVAVEAALALQGEVVNADSMQVYRGMDIGTAKPTPEERKGVPHHLLDVAAPDEEFNAARYRSLALPVISGVLRRGKVCLVVGGTGLYLRSLLGGLSGAPPGDMKLRAQLMDLEREVGSRVLHERLRRLDPEAAGHIHPNDGVRIRRALEVCRLTGRRFSEINREHGFSEGRFEALKFCLHVEREELYRRIDLRAERMVEDGLIEEVRGLLEQGYSPTLKPMRSIGYRHMVAYLQGSCALDETLRLLKRDTRRYAKRQLTWFRSDPQVHWTNPAELDQLVEKIKAFALETA
ncbi:MAG: tRNA (adenosine(37)-N6)-dimethylallyltransferase MiaA [Deltaproteobacteria bacterium]|nr:tRNA (adenosine(37)-N6)-dimethylallyltransferase MiaA [Deltaproteobacteria bacterium]MBW2007955.1 tRNA (adenosine(37)-N6)-dimethylallyltransferase MiaA [Deltaproteobacteria bacterium]